MKSTIRILIAILLICLLTNRAGSATLRIFASRTGPGTGSPAELTPGNPNYQRNPVFEPGEPIYVWAQTEPGKLFTSIGVDLEAHDRALLNGPVTVPNPVIAGAPGQSICRWNGFIVGSPSVPPSVASIINIKMVCVPIPGGSCEYVGVSNPVNSLDRFDGFNDPQTDSVLFVTLKAAGVGGSCFFIVNNLLIVDYPQSGSIVYFGWGDEPVSGVTTGAKSLLPDWYIEPDTDSDGVLDKYDNCVAVINAPQLDSDGDGRGDRCDRCRYRKTGDMTNDGIVDVNDIEAFGAMLLNPTAETNDDLCAADADYSSLVDGADISPFLAILLANGGERSMPPTGSGAHNGLNDFVVLDGINDLRPGALSRTFTVGTVAAPPINSSADLNHDGTVDGRDIESFVTCTSGDAAVPSSAMLNEAEAARFVDSLLGR